MKKKRKISSKTFKAVQAEIDRGTSQLKACRKFNVWPGSFKAWKGKRVGIESPKHETKTKAVKPDLSRLRMLMSLVNDEILALSKVIA